MYVCMYVCMYAFVYAIVYVIVYVCVDSKDDMLIIYLTKYVLQVGEIFWFSGDLFHGGNSYESSNTRMHGYFATSDYDMSELVTHWMI
jgi:type IV secretory pathway VirB3-like protein